MKKLTILLVLALLLCACTAQPPVSTNPPETTESPIETTEAPPETTEATEETTEATEATEETTEATQPPETTGTEMQIPALSLAEQVYDREPAKMDIMASEINLQDPDLLNYYLGLDSADGLIGAGAIDPLMSASPFSLVVVQCQPDADVKAIADSIAAGVDPFKWICVGAEDVRTTVKGDYILLTMMTADQADFFIQAFLEILP